jgi:hypothetical protein
MPGQRILEYMLIWRNAVLITRMGIQYDLELRIYSFKQIQEGRSGGRVDRGDDWNYLGRVPGWTGYYALSSAVSGIVKQTA